MTMRRKLENESLEIIQMSENENLRAQIREDAENVRIGVVMKKT